MWALLFVLRSARSIVLTMNIFGIGPIELLIIVVLGLVIFGPERLPGIGRQIGKMVARVLAWQYTSPEAQLLMDIRRDLEKEITDIRDEMIRARQALDIRPEIQQTLFDAQEAVREAQGAAQEAAREAEIAIRAPYGATVAAPAPNAALFGQANGVHPLADAPTTIVSPTGELLLDVEPLPSADIVSPAGEPLLDIVRPAPSLAFSPNFADFPAPPVLSPPTRVATPNFADFPAPPVLGSPSLVAAAPAQASPYVNGASSPAAPIDASPKQVADFELLVMQIQALANDMAAMREQLRRNGLLDAGWEPTSALLNGTHADEPVALAD